MVNTTAIQLRHDTAANWTSDNPTLAAGEMGMETDTKKFKFGDGSTAWNSLSYAGGSAGVFKYGLYTLSANQPSNFGLNTHVEFNTTDGSLGGLSTGSGQANGIITLPAGKTYKISASMFPMFSNAGYTVFQMYDRTNSVFFGRTLEQHANTGGFNYAPTSTLVAFITPTTNIDVDLRVTGTISGTTTTYWAPTCWLLIEEYGGY
jgi:hypothetical protein